jgi:hypothetical protein
MGGCWVREEIVPVNLWKIASFSDTSAFNLAPNQFQTTLNPLITAELQPVFSSFQGSDTVTHFKCSAAGHSFRTSIHNGTVPLCVWSKMQRGPTGSLTLTLLGVYPDHDFRPDFACNGVARRSLMVIIHETSDIQSIRTYLTTDKRYAGIISEAGQIGQTLITVRLHASYDFQEDVVKGLIESDPYLASDLRLVEYDGMVSVVGETYRLFAGHYPGFSATP